MALHRREFLRGSLLLGGGLVTGGGLLVPLIARGTEKKSEIELTDWIWIASNGDVTIGISQCEAGQGVYTGLAQVLADELDADWSRVSVKFVTGRDAYRNSAAYEPPQQFVGASMSVTQFYDRLRHAGAQAREALTSAGAARLGVRPSQCRTKLGRVLHRATGRSFGYGELAADAARLELNPHPKLKPVSQFHLVGRNLPRLDTRAKTDGSAQFGIDVHVPGMMYGAVRMAARLDGEIVRVRNESAIKSMPGVVAVILTSQWPSSRVNTAIVIADSFWNAKQACDAAELDERAAEPGVDSKDIHEQCKRALAAEHAAVACRIGDSDAVLAKTGRRIVEAEYHTPYVTHATMEPMCATAHYRGTEVEVWGPIQGQDMVREWVGKLFQLPPASVIVNTTFLGGSFGRKFVPDFVLHAVEASKAVGRPVKVIRSREEDMRHGYYRPNASGRFRAALGKDGLPEALHARIVGQSLYANIKEDKFQAVGWDETMVEAIHDLVYRVPNLTVEAVHVQQPIPVSFMRSVGSTSSIFFLESFVSEMAVAAGSDDYSYRRKLLEGNELALRVLDRAAELLNWRQPAAPGIHRGLSFNLYTGRAEAFQSYVAVGVELRLSEGTPKLTRAVCAIDCGRAINPGLIRANVEGGIGFGLTNTFKSEITLQQSAVVQSNFHDYPLLMLAEMPAIEVSIIDSDRQPQGCGEIAVSPVAPAVASAIFSATGKRHRSMPFKAD